MVKRKQVKDDVAMGDADEDQSDEEIVNVDFEWFDPQPAVDFHGLKNLLRQLFDNDSQEFDLSGLADLILSQPLLGSTVKVDGNESDPYAFLTVLNIQEHRDKPVIQQLTSYMRTKAASNPSLSSLASLLSQDPVPPVGLILTDRLINMPSEIVPPMYIMLQEEIAWALEDKEPYNFSHYVIVSKNYEEVESKLDMEDERPQKKKRRSGKAEEQAYFHPEDEVLERHAACSGSFEWTHQHDEGHSDSKRAFAEMGIKTGGNLLLIEAGRFEDAVKDVTDYLKPPV